MNYVTHILLHNYVIQAYIWITRSIFFICSLYFYPYWRKSIVIWIVLTKYDDVGVLVKSHLCGKSRHWKKWNSKLNDKECESQMLHVRFQVANWWIITNGNLLTCYSLYYIFLYRFVLDKKNRTLNNSYLKF